MDRLVEKDLLKIKNIGTLKQQGQMNEYQNKEFVVHIFCQVSRSFLYKAKI